MKMPFLVAAEEIPASAGRWQLAEIRLRRLRRRWSWVHSCLPWTAGHQQGRCRRPWELVLEVEESQVQVEVLEGLQVEAMT